MRPPSRRKLALFGAVAAWAVFAGCSRPAPPVKELNGPPDLVKNGKWDNRWRAYRLGTFHLNHIWGGAGHQRENDDYRMKLTLRADPPKDGKVVAEIFFHDVLRADVHGNPDPNQAQAPYKLHFPSSTFGVIMQALRNANAPVYLYYYDDQWSVGVDSEEVVGVD